MNRREMSPDQRVAHDIARFVERRANITRHRAQELAREAEAFERVQKMYEDASDDQHVRDDARRFTRVDFGR